jgi:hypothetical protein
MADAPIQEPLEDLVSFALVDFHFSAISYRRIETATAGPRRRRSDRAGLRS